MAQQTINIGTVANDGTGDPLRTAWTKANGNFTELYARPTGGSGTINSGTLNTIAYYAASGTALSPLTLGTGLSVSGTTLNATGGSGSGTVNSGTTNTLAFYAGSGTAVSPLTLGTNLSITGTTLNAAGGGGSFSRPVTTVAASGASQALTFATTSGDKAYDVTLTGNCAFTLTGGNAGQAQEVWLIIRGGAGGFAPTLPSGIKWPGGVAPTVDTSAGSYNEFYLRTVDGGTTVSGNY